MRVFDKQLNREVVQYENFLMPGGGSWEYSVQPQNRAIIASFADSTVRFRLDPHDFGFVFSTHIMNWTNSARVPALGSMNSVLYDFSRTGRGSAAIPNFHFDRITGSTDIGPRGETAVWRVSTDEKKMVWIISRSRPSAEVYRRAFEVGLGDNYSPVGGPFAELIPATRQPYLFSFDGIRPADVDGWISAARSVGAKQIQFHGGDLYRFGDYEVARSVYPRGLQDMRTVNGKLRSEGILPGMQVYTFMLDKRSRFVTPRPHPGLATGQTWTLAENVARGAKVLTLNARSAADFQPAGLTLRVGEELVLLQRVVGSTSTTVRIEVERGALGTADTAHRTGANISSLREAYGHFLVNPRTPLFDQLIDATVNFYNQGNFGAIYFDGIETMYSLTSEADGWYWGAKFVTEVLRRLDEPPLVEFSSYIENFYPYISRYNAWDAPERDYIPFFERHFASNRRGNMPHIPRQMGWIAYHVQNGLAIHNLYPEDLDVVGLAHLLQQQSFSLLNVDHRNYRGIYNFERLSERLKMYVEAADRFGGRTQTFRPEMVSNHTLRRSDRGYTLRPQRIEDYDLLAGLTRRGFSLQPIESDSNRLIRIEFAGIAEIGDRITNRAPTGGGLPLAEFMTPEQRTPNRTAPWDQASIAMTVGSQGQRFTYSIGDRRMTARGMVGFPLPLIPSFTPVSAPAGATDLTNPRYEFHRGVMPINVATDRANLHGATGEPTAIFPKSEPVRRVEMRIGDARFTMENVRPGSYIEIEGGNVRIVGPFAQLAEPQLTNQIASQLPSGFSNGRVDVEFFPGDPGVGAIVRVREVVVGAPIHRFE
jgi:hypothetical protein